MACNHIFILPNNHGSLQAIIELEDGRRIVERDDRLYPTLNRKEADLILKALLHLREGESVFVHCYSNYIPNSLNTDLIRYWKAKAWKNQEFVWKNQNDEIVKNYDLLQKLDFLRMKLNIIFLRPGEKLVQSVDLFEGIQKRLEKEVTKNV